MADPAEANRSTTAGSVAGPPAWVVLYGTAAEDNAGILRKVFLDELDERVELRRIAIERQPDDVLALFCLCELPLRGIRIGHATMNARTVRSGRCRAPDGSGRRPCPPTPTTTRRGW